MILLAIFFYAISLFIFYLVIKSAVKGALEEEEEIMKKMIKDAVVDALKQHDYIKENK